MTVIEFNEVVKVLEGFIFFKIFLFLDLFEKVCSGMLGYFKIANDVLNFMSDIIFLLMPLLFLPTMHKIIDLTFLVVFLIEEILECFIGLSPLSLLLYLTLGNSSICIRVLNLFQVSLILLIIEADSSQTFQAQLSIGIALYIKEWLTMIPYNLFIEIYFLFHDYILYFN